MTGRQAGVGVLVRTELFKIASSRWQPVALTGILILHVPLMLWAGQDAAASWDGLRSRSGLFTGYFTMAFGVLVVTQDYRYRTAVLAFLAVPGRRRITIAQGITVAAVGVTLSAVLFAAWLVVGVVRYGGPGMHLDRPADVAGAYAVVAVTVWAAGAVGVGVDTLLRGPTGALLALGGCGMFKLFPDATRFRGPVTAPLGVLAWPTSELEVTSLASAVCWGSLAVTAGLFAVRRDLPS